MNNGEPKAPQISTDRAKQEGSENFLSPEEARRRFQISSLTDISGDYYNEIHQLIGHESWNCLVRGDNRYEKASNAEFLRIIINKLPERLAAFPTYTERQLKKIENRNAGAARAGAPLVREEDVFSEKAKEAAKKIDDLVLQVRSFADKDLTNLEVLKELDSKFLQMNTLIYGPKT